VLGKTSEQIAPTTTNAQMKFEVTTTSQVLKGIHFLLTRGEEKTGRANEKQNKRSHNKQHPDPKK